MTEKWDEIKGKLRYALIGFLSCFIFKDFSGKKKSTKSFGIKFD